MACSNDVTDKLNNNAVGSEELAANIKRIRQLTKDLQATTDCDAIKQKLGITGDELKDLTKDIRNEAKKLLEKYLPITKFPTNPLKLIPWVKKLVTGSIMPQLEAYIKLLQQVIQLVQATQEFIQAAQQVLPRLEQCAVDTINQEIQGAVGVINQTIQGIVNDIVSEINDAICKSGIADLAGAVNDAVGTTKQLIRDVNDTADIATNAINTGLSNIQEIGDIASDITGVPFTVDTSSPSAFVNSVNSGAFQTFQAGVQTFLEKEPAKNTETPTVTGSATVGQTLTANTGAWSGDDVTFSYQWYRGEEPIYGATNQTYTIVGDDEGKTITVQVSGDNDAGGEFANTAATVEVTTAPPEILTLPVITGTAEVGQTLTVNTGVWDYPGWAGEPTYTYQWQWARLSANIYNANTNSYVVNTEDVNHTLTCIVTATSNSGTANARATPTSAVVGGEPFNGIDLGEY